MCFLDFLFDWLEFMSSYLLKVAEYGSPVALVFFAFMQYKVISEQKNIQSRQEDVQQKQHNLDLFNKRWAMLEELTSLGAEAMTFKHIYHEDLKKDDSSEKNYYTIANKLNVFAEKCVILFNIDMSQQFKKIHDDFIEYHRTLDSIEEWKKYHEECPEQYTKEKKQKLEEKKINLDLYILKSFDSFYKDMLTFIQLTEV